MPEPQADYDSPWKDVIERFFPAFMEFFCAEAHAGINWSKGYESSIPSFSRWCATRTWGGAMPTGWRASG